MDTPWQRPPGKISSGVRQAHPRATLPTDDDDNDGDDGGGIVLEASRVEADLLLNSDNSRVDNRDGPEGEISATCLASEHNTNQSCPSIESCVRGQRVQTQLDIKKRKLHALSTSAPAKKVKVEGNTSVPQSLRSWQLPTQIWQRIFIFLPPKMLGRLLSVNKCFNFLLDPLSNSACNAQISPANSSLLNLKPEVIWQFSRRRFWPTMPAPLQDQTELQMWRLACQVRCQLHDRVDQAVCPAYDSSNAENETASRPIWSFALRSCRSCLVDRTIKEVDLLLSSSIPSCLIPALPFVFIDDKMHVVSSAMLQTGYSATKSPITKIFLSSHVAAIREEFASVRAMGEATAEEWMKGLEGRGRERRTDSLRWEKFEISGGITRMQQRLSSDDTRASDKANKALGSSGVLPSLRKQEGPLEHSRSSDSSGIAPAIPIHSSTYSRESSCGRSTLGRQVLSQVGIPRNKTREEAEELKAARRAEIEKRVAKLKPPLPAHILALCPSFQAAIQITSPLDDTAWDLLKCRLIAQRRDIDQEKLGRPEVLDHSKTPLRRLEDLRTSQKVRLETKHQVDKTWDDAQAPLRARISVLADHIIRDGWGNGRRINKESSPQFAAEVLMYVRRQFYAEIEKDDATARASGQQPIRDISNGPYTRKLTLENMKWLFDVKIKPLTERYGKEIFYCHGCEFNTKPYGFEGVVQHYAAKHTSCLSLGTVVVYWRAEWPAVAPFHPEPHNLKQQQAGPRRHKSNWVLGATYRDQPPHQDGAKPNYGQPVQPVYNTVPFQPPYHQSSPYVAPLHGSIPSQSQVSQSLNNPPLVGTTYHGPIEAVQGVGVYRPVQTSNMDAYQSNSSIAYQNHIGQVQSSYVPSPVIDHQKLEDIARNSRELWFSMAPLKELPGPIRIFVVIHHMATRFRARFSQEPSLALFIDGLSNSKEMRPVRNLNGLRCKACRLRLGITTVEVQNKESYSLPQLVKHFHQRHIEQQYAIGVPVLNWCTDMIFLPDLSILSNLEGLKNVDSRKLSLIYSAFPRATSGDPQSHATTLLANNDTPDYRGHSHTIHPSNQPLLIYETRGQPVRIIQHATQRGTESYNADEDRLETTQPVPNPGVRHDLSIIVKPSEPRAGHPPTHKSSAGTAVTANMVARTNVPSSRQTARPHQASGGGCELVEDVKDDEDDDFDLIAGLESQLDRQASSTGPDNPLGLAQ
ncbi:hypothetical protein O1611_g3120 [Lasiodiplodia mahajangana]|uniref:Uncharacterized protein n=1 Tax=Lasiodiplodia mahajangana TaxID=1108764 RepID=A0ACC2JT43_9PEZI|nr:hypothetical protein O1611_g3120 [Lasiodiplodia mahajangana]